MSHPRHPGVRKTFPQLYLPKVSIPGTTTQRWFLLKYCNCFVEEGFDIFRILSIPIDSLYQWNILRRKLNKLKNFFFQEDIENILLDGHAVVTTMDVSFLEKIQNRWLTSLYTKWIIKHHNLVISSKTKWIFRWTMISPCIQVGFIPVHSVRLICWVPLMKDDDWLQTTNKWWLNSIECFHCSYLKQWFYCFFHLLTNFKMVLFRTGGWDQTEPTNGSPRKTLGHFPSTLIRAEKSNQSVKV